MDYECSRNEFENDKVKEKKNCLINLLRHLHVIPRSKKIFSSNYSEDNDTKWFS